MDLKPRTRIEKESKEIEETILEPIERKTPISMEKVISTGSTLLDLAISGKRRKGGGIPGGILTEIFGPPSAGKTALLAEICASVQVQGGKVKYLDPEGRLDREYAEIYGLELDKENYDRPDTVGELFEKIWNWETSSSVINAIGADSVAAFSTDMELKDGDKYGMRRAKEFSEGLRKTCRLIAHDNRLVIFTNQIREKTESMGFGPKETTPGGMAIPFYASLRIRIGPYISSKIKREVTISTGSKMEKTIGIKSIAYIAKSSIDDPYREAIVNIIFGYGIDDIRGNLEYLKLVMGGQRYNVNGKEIQSIDRAIMYVEENNLQKDIREQVIHHWTEIENRFVSKRMPKVRH